MYEVYGFVRSATRTQDGTGSSRHVYRTVPDRNTAERLALELMETRDDLVFTTFEEVPANDQRLRHI